MSDPFQVTFHLPKAASITVAATPGDKPTVRGLLQKALHKRIAGWPASTGALLQRYRIEHEADSVLLDSIIWRHDCTYHGLVRNTMVETDDGFLELWLSDRNASVLSSKRRSGRLLRTIKPPGESELDLPPLMSSENDEIAALIAQLDTRRNGESRNDWRARLDAEIGQLSELNDNPVTGGSMASLLPNELINDEVVNFVVEMMREREKQAKTAIRCAFAHSNFYKRLCFRGPADWKHVKRWTRKGHLKDWHLKDFFLVMIHLPEQKHWTLVNINLRDGRLEYYCSLLDGPGRILNDLRMWLRCESESRGITLKVPAQDFELCDMAAFINSQRGVDCGMWILRRADLLSRNVRASLLLQKDMLYFRRITMLEILKCAFLDVSNGQGACDLS